MRQLRTGGQLEKIAGQDATGSLVRQPRLGFWIVRGYMLTWYTSAAGQKWRFGEQIRRIIPPIAIFAGVFDS
jgi:hypothetical protein